MTRRLFFPLSLKCFILLSFMALLSTAVISYISVFRYDSFRSLAFNAAICAGALFVITVFSLLFFREYKARLTLLTRVALDIRLGRYTRPMKLSGDDEITELFRRWTAMRKALAHFETFSSKTLVNMARRRNLEPVARNREIIAAMIFVRNFGEKTDLMSAEDVVSFANDFLSVVIPHVTEHDGVVDKILTHDGISVLCVWGAFAGRFDIELLAQSAAVSVLNIREEMTSFKEYIKKKNPALASTDWGCALNAGVAVTGGIGSQDFMEYSIIGESLRVTARLSWKTNEYDEDIILSETAYLQLRDFLDMKKLEDGVYTLVGVKEGISWAANTK